MTESDTFCWHWCRENHPNHHPSIGDIVVIKSELVYGLEGRKAVVLRQAEGTEHGDVKIALIDDNNIPTGTQLTVGYTEIGPS